MTIDLECIVLIKTNCRPAAIVLVLYQLSLIMRTWLGWVLIVNNNFETIGGRIRVDATGDLTMLGSGACSPKNSYDDSLTNDVLDHEQHRTSAFFRIHYRAPWGTETYYMSLCLAHDLDLRNEHFFTLPSALACDSRSCKRATVRCVKY
jgi:hypothetical protein